MLLAPPALAHAIVVDAEPRVNAEVPAAGFPVKLRFNSRIDHKRSRLLVLDRNGAEIEIPHEADAPADQLLAKVPSLAPGSYKLRWQVLAIDGHVTRGDIPFKVAK